MVKDDPIEHLRDSLTRIEAKFVKQRQARKPLNIKIPFFEELIVSLAGLGRASTSTAAAAAAAAAAASSSAALSVSTALDAMLTQIGGEELVNRLRFFMDGCRKMNMSAETQSSRLRVLALALASLSVISKVFVTTLGASDAELLAVRPSSSPFGACAVGSFLEMWLEAIEELPLLALGLIQAVTRNTKCITVCAS